MIESSVLKETRDVVTVADGINMIKPGRKNVEYLEFYHELISQARKSRGIIEYNYPYSVSKNVYKNTQIHHIILKAEGGDDMPENQVIFTPFEHTLSHLLLYKWKPENNKYLEASWSMIFRPGASKGYYRIPFEDMRKILETVEGQTLEELMITNRKKNGRSVSLYKDTPREDKWGEYMMSFDTVKEAAIKLDRSLSTIHRYLNEKCYFDIYCRYVGGGYFLMYDDE